jgi:hypothetical protein
MSREGGELWPFPFPSSQVSSLSGRSLFLAPLPAFPDTAHAAPFPRWRARVKSGPSGGDSRDPEERLCSSVPQMGGDAYPTSTAFALSLRLHTHTHTHTHSLCSTPGLKGNQPAVESMGRQPSWAQLRGRDEVVMTWVGVRLAWMTQGSGHLP